MLGSDGTALVSAVLASLPAHTAVLDRDGRITAVNGAWEAFRSENDGQASRCGVGVDYLAVCEATTGECRDEALAAAAGIRAVLAGTTDRFAMDYDCSAPGEERWFQMLVVPLQDVPRSRSAQGPVVDPVEVLIPAQPDGGRPSTVPEGIRGGVVVTHSDITGRKLEEVALVHEATHDGLTGLLNRQLLLAELRRNLHKAHLEGRTVALLYFDLDGFKTVNDSLGHHAGDDLLRATAERLRATVRPGDLVGRLGGDEFVAVLPRTGLTGARRLARRLAAATREPVELDGMAMSVTVSIGIAVSRETPTLTSPDDLLAEADAAMYKAKRRGRARTEVFEGVLRHRAERRGAVEAELQTALEDGGLHLFRQPVVCLDDGSVVAGEALLRWFSPDGRLHAPDSFLDVAAHTRVMAGVTRAVLLSAAQQVALEDGGRVSVNLASADLRSPVVMGDIRQAVEDASLPTGALTVEIPESAVLDDLHRIARTLAALHSFGVRVCLHDFGRGSCSLLELAKLPVDEIKLDRGLVSGLDRRANRAVVRAVATFTHDLGTQLVATGVETWGQRQALQDLGVDLGQGWLLGPPEPWALVGRPGVDQGSLNA